MMPWWNNLEEEAEVSIAVALQLLLTQFLTVYHKTHLLLKEPG